MLKKTKCQHVRVMTVKMAEHDIKTVIIQKIQIVSFVITNNHDDNMNDM